MTQPRPITDRERAAVRRHHAAGMTRNAIARKINRSSSTVSKIAAEMGLTFKRGAEVVAATEARRIDLAARRIDLAHAQQIAAERLNEQLFAPCIVGAFGGKENVWTQQDLSQPLFGDQRQIVAATGQAITNSLKLAPATSGESSDQVASVLSKLGEAFGAVFADDNSDDDGGDTGG